jgi:hypothetical protein
LFNNDFVNGVQNQVNQSKVLSKARMAGQPIKGLDSRAAIFPMGSMQDDEIEKIAKEL